MKNGSHLTSRGFFRCVACGAFPLPPPEGNSIICPLCGFLYELTDKSIKYDYKKLLSSHYPREYPLYSVLNNNGLLSYLFWPAASISLTERADVIRFKDYIVSHYRKGNILDIGCGPMEIPGYLNFRDDASTLFGLDPLEDSRFSGFLIKGCAEFIPFPDNFFSTLIFATSLDHVCSLKDTIKEIKRILSPSGVVIIWSSDVGIPLLWKIQTFRDRLFQTLKTGTNAFRYVSGPDNSVYLIPPGAVDPFHKEILTPKEIIKCFGLEGFKCDNFTRNSSQELFFTFSTAE